MRLPTLLLLLAPATPALALEPIPDKLVVLTFDDSSKSHVTVAAPLLKKHGFGATFFVTEGFDFPTNKRDYMTWDEIAQLHRDGFEIGNHTRDHKAPERQGPEGDDRAARSHQRPVPGARHPPARQLRLPRQRPGQGRPAHPSRTRDQVRPARRSARVPLRQGPGLRLRAGARPPAAHPLGRRRPPRLDARRLQAGRLPGQRRQDRRHPAPRRPRHGPLLGQHADALVRVVRQVPRRQRLPGDRPPRPRPLRRSHRRPLEPLGRDRGPQGACSPPAATARTPARPSPTPTSAAGSPRCSSTTATPPPRPAPPSA